MKLIYAREGGLYFQVSEAEIEVEDLPEDLKSLAKKAFDNPASYRSDKKNANLRDGYQYRLELRDGRKKINLTFDDLTLPDGFQPLIQYLQEKTKNS